MEAPAQGDVILDKYTVEWKLGRGGMGFVVAARHRHLGELHAIKFLTGMSTPELTERFWREGRAGAQLRGQHVAHVHDLGKLPNGVPYMVMEYLRGSDLRTLLLRDGPFQMADAIIYLLQTCEALAEAHDAGIVHRDVKPANLFLWERPFGEPFIKVLDFGISKQQFQDEDALTMTKGFLGSPPYMSPEQIVSPKIADARSDIWSLGVVLYELLVGSTPFHAETLLAIISRIAKDEPIPIRNFRPDIPATLETVIMRCLRKSPDERYQRVEDLAAALVDVLQSLVGPDSAIASILKPPADALKTIVDDFTSSSPQVDSHDTAKDSQPPQNEPVEEVVVPEQTVTSPQDKPPASETQPAHTNAPAPTWTTANGSRAKLRSWAPTLVGLGLLLISILVILGITPSLQAIPVSSMLNSLDMVVPSIHAALPIPPAPSVSSSASEPAPPLLPAPTPTTSNAAGVRGSAPRKTDSDSKRRPVLDHRNPYGAPQSARNPYTASSSAVEPAAPPPSTDEQPKSKSDAFLERHMGL